LNRSIERAWIALEWRVDYRDDQANWAGQAIWP
jgi:hypothetical protein